MTLTDFEQRKSKILGTIVEAYVASATPVGSQFIAKRLRSSLSPATIRHIMGELEHEGYLEQPHISAGRVPTDRGYRYYVDSIMGTQQLTQDELQQIQALVEQEEMDVERLFEQADIMLAQLTQQAAFLIAPTIKQSIVRQIELVPLGGKRLLCVLIGREEMVATQVVEVENSISHDEAIALVRFINSELVGIPFNDLLDSLERRLLTETDSFYHLVKRSLVILQHALSMQPNERLLVEGTSYVISQPEFLRNPQKARDLLRQLEDQEELLQGLRSELTGEGVHVRIGHEIPLQTLDECSVLIAPFVIGEEALGGIGVIGPKRMDYSRASALVEATVQAVTQTINQWVS